METVLIIEMSQLSREAAVSVRNFLNSLADAVDTQYIFKRLEREGHEPSVPSRHQTWDKNKEPF